MAQIAPALETALTTGVSLDQAQAQYTITERVAAAIRAYACYGVSEDGDDRFGRTVHPEIFVKEKEERKELYRVLAKDLVDKVSFALTLATRPPLTKF